MPLVWCYRNSGDLTETALDSGTNGSYSVFFEDDLFAHTEMI